jgi:hypothetical protein
LIFIYIPRPMGVALMIFMKCMQAISYVLQRSTPAVLECCGPDTYSLSPNQWPLQKKKPIKFSSRAIARDQGGKLTRVWGHSLSYSWYKINVNAIFNASKVCCGRNPIAVLQQWKYYNNTIASFVPRPAERVANISSYNIIMLTTPAQWKAIRLTGWWISPTDTAQYCITLPNYTN